MHVMTTAIVLGTLALAPAADAQVFFTEQFDYPDGDLSAVSGGLWTGHSGSPPDIQVQGGQAVVTAPGSMDDNRLAGAVMGPADVWYYGLRFRVDLGVGPTINNDYFIHLKDDGFGFNARLGTTLAPPGPPGDFGLEILASSPGDGSEPWPGAFFFGEEITAVVRWDNGTGEATLWINPIEEFSPSVTDDELPDAMRDIEAVALRQDSSSSSVVSIDVLSLGTDFDAVLAALVSGPCEQVLCGDGRDPFATVPMKSFIDFGAGGVPPIPPDFFFPGSAPIIGPVNLEGCAINPDLAGLTDTIVQRSGPVNFPGAGFPRPADPVQIEIVELALTGVEPIDVSGENWYLGMGLAGDQPQGSLDAIIESPNGGSYQGLLPVKPLLAFARETELDLLAQGLILPEDVDLRILDWDLAALPPVNMGWEAPAPFATVPPADGSFFCPEELANPFPFFPGVSPGDSDGPVCASDPFGGGLRQCLQPPPPPALSDLGYALLGAVTPVGSCGSACTAPEFIPCVGPPAPFRVVVFQCVCRDGYCVGYYGLVTEACCFPDGTCTDEALASCIDLGGTPQGPDTDCGSTVCVPTEACCLLTGGCVDIAPALCEGIPQGPGTTCVDADCPQPGACCFDDGSCTFGFESDCIAGGGTYQGDGITCVDADCPQPGACCFDDGSCTFGFESDCIAGGGTYQGDGITCVDADCPQPGACCFDDGSCTFGFEADCIAGGGTYQGDGITCVDADCPQPGACCFDDGSCTFGFESDCIAGGGTYQGDGVTCVDAGLPAAGCVLLRRRLVHVWLRSGLYRRRRDVPGRRCHVR